MRLSKNAGLVASCLLILLLLPACQPRPPAEAIVPDRPDRVEPWPEFDYDHAATEGAKVYELAPEQSRIDIVVRREGPLQRLGHDHAISVKDAAGFLLLADRPGLESRAELRFRADQLVVDASEVRTRYQLDTNPDADDIQATRENLLKKVLMAEEWPYISIAVSDFQPAGEGFSVLAEFTVRGTTSSSRHDFSLNTTDADLSIEGHLSIRQTELGIEPFSVLGGGLRVADQLEIHFRLAALPQP
jgi:hypothetical protein